MKTYIIAEMAWSHDGSATLARDIVKGASEAGADAISIHITDMPSYMVRHYGTGAGRVSACKEAKPIFDYLAEINLSQSDWQTIADEVKRTGLDLIVMPNDGASLVFARTLQPAAYVISAACFEEHDFVSAIGRESKPIYLRVGGATLGEIETVVNLLRNAGNPAVTLLYGHQNYPTPLAETNIRFLSCLQSTFGLPVGIADHIDADDEFALIAPLLALPLGVTCIEKHVTHDRAKKGEDFESALNPSELARLVRLVRAAESVFGRDSAISLDESSATYRRNVRKRLVAARDIREGEALTADMIVPKRSDEGLSPTEIPKLLGRRTRKALERDQGITFDMV